MNKLISLFLLLTLLFGCYTAILYYYNESSNQQDKINQSEDSEKEESDELLQFQLKIFKLTKLTYERETGKQFPFYDQQEWIDWMIWNDMIEDDSDPKIKLENKHTLDAKFDCPEKYEWSIFALESILSYPWGGNINYGIDVRLL